MSSKSLIKLAFTKREQKQKKGAIQGRQKENKEHPLFSLTPNLCSGRCKKRRGNMSQIIGVETNIQLKAAVKVTISKSILIFFLLVSKSISWRNGRLGCVNGSGGRFHFFLFRWKFFLLRKGKKFEFVEERKKVESLMNVSVF